MFKVETHNNSKEYFENLKIEENALYITPTISLAFAMREKIKLSEENCWRILGIENLVEKIFINDDIIRKIKLKTEVRLIINKLKKIITNEAILKEFKYFEDNISFLISDINYILQCNLVDFNYKEDNITKKAFKIIYEELLKCEIYKEISKDILNINVISSFYKSIDGYNGQPIKRIYFYNINNLDMKRWLIIEYLNKLGFEIIFRIPYFNGLEVANKSWNTIYGDKSIFDWQDDIEVSKKNYVNSNYINYLEGNKKDIYLEEKVVTKTYYEISDFRKQMKDKNVISFYKEGLENCKYSEIVDNNKPLEVMDHCYQTSIGRFLFHLYRVKVENNTVKIDFNLYRELITSGWIETQGWNGVRLREYLSKNEAYFEKVTNIDEILGRLNTLKDLEEVNLIFEGQSKEQIKNDSQKKLLLNPFRAFGYNNLEDYSVTATYMVTLTTRLKNLILKTFEEEDGLINIKNHFELLKFAFRNKYITEKYKSGSEIEKTTIRKIWGILNNNKSFPPFMHLEDIPEWFNVLFKFKEEKDIKESYYSIDHLDGLIYRDEIVNYKGKNRIHITDLSYKAYEEYLKSKNNNSKVLRDEDLEDIFNNSFSGEYKDIILKGLKLKKLSSDSAEDYLKYILTNLFINFEGEKEFSWIEGLRKNDSKSIILKQIESIYDNKEEVDQYLDFNEIIEEKDIVVENCIYYDKEELLKNHDKYPEVSYKNLDFCDNKFLYSSILNANPIYYSDFHTKLAFSSLVSVLKNSIEDSYYNISRFIFPLFPQWEDVVKQNILTCEYGRKNIRNYKYFNGINYPKNIDSLYQLKSKYIVGENWKIKNRYNKGNFKQEEYYGEFIKDYLENDVYNSGNHCSMCPHIYLCKKGEFVIDNR